MAAAIHIRLPLRHSLLACMLLGAQAQAGNWLLLTHSTDGQVAYRDGPLHGLPHGGKRAFFVELLLQLQQDLQLQAALRDVPLARGWQTLRTQPGVALFNLNRTPTREDQARWVGPIWQEADYLYERSAYPTGVSRLEEARLLPVCVLNGNVHDQRLSQLGFSRLSRSDSYEGCLQMLVAGRVALVVSSSRDFAQKLRAADISPREVSQLPVKVNDDDGYIALSPDTPTAEVQRWQEALERLRRSGAYQQLYRQFAQ
ncbi:substrate-binding periplasmic protein [Vogesella facilis]|uniref:Substrate-binding periplasmic protein n=1 Tax=Vogesella facilis TaxID=1655232 RepID=A0ABV7RED7_9NEIS